MGETRLNAINAANGEGSGANGEARARVLVVEDEESLCALACHWLKALGFAASGVHSAGEALVRLGKEPFDLLFTDIAMPGSMDGLALARKAKQAHPSMRVLIASAYGANLLVDHELPGEFLHKPYTKETLAKAVDEVLAV